MINFPETLENAKDWGIPPGAIRGCGDENTFQIISLQDFPVIFHFPLSSSVNMVLCSASQSCIVLSLERKPRSLSEIHLSCASARHYFGLESFCYFHFLFFLPVAAAMRVTRRNGILVVTFCLPLTLIFLYFPSKGEQETLFAFSLVLTNECNGNHQDKTFF